MIENGIRGGICHAIHIYTYIYIYTHAKANNNYMKNYDKNKESSYIQYLNPNNLCRWAVSQKLLVDGFKRKKILLSLIKTLNYDDDSEENQS